MATTTDGWPYVLPADHPLEFPASSQALADKLQNEHVSSYLGTFTPSAGWVDFGGTYGGMHMTRVGRLVHLAGSIKPTADKAVVTGTPYLIAQGALGSVRAAMAPVVYSTSSAAANLLGRIYVETNGLVQFYASTNATITAASGFIGIEITYRSTT